MSTSKGTTYLQRLEAARCNGDWGAVRELCRKVVKHAPGRRCLAMAAETEARIHKLLPPPSPKASPSTIVSYIVSLDALQDTLQDELNKSPPAATKLPNPAGGGFSPVTTSDDLIDARVTVAWCCMLKGEWSDVLKLLPTEDEVSEEGDSGSGGGAGSRVKGGYIHIARIKSLVLQGIALSHTNQKDFSLPLQLYRTAIRQASTLPVAQRASPSFLEWTERALSHSALTAYRCWLENNSPAIPLPPATTCLITPRKHEKTKPEWKTDAEQAQPPTPVPSPPVPSTPEIPPTPEIGTALSKTITDETTVVSAFKSFHNFVAELPGQTQPTIITPSLGSDLQRDSERREVYRHYFRFLSTLLLPNHHPDFPSPRDLLSGPPIENGSNTISMVHSPTNLVLAAKAGTKSQLRAELNLVQNTYEAYLTQTYTFPSAADFHEPIGEFVDLIALNWRAAGASGIDAESVVEILYRAATKTFHSPRILRHLFYTLTSMGNLSDAVLALETYLDLSENAKERMLKGKIEKDFDPDGTVLVTAAEGVRMICKYVGNGEKGFKIAKRIKEWIEKWQVDTTEVSACVYRGIGTANATWARQTLVGEDREDILKAAERAFLKGLEYAPQDVDAWYGLALVQVDLLDVHAAIDSLGRGLAILGAPPSFSSKDDGYTSRATPFLHALSLLLSAREEYEASTVACTTALALISSHADLTALSIEMKEIALQFQMTLMALSEATLGPEAAIGMSEYLLSLYTRLFPPPLRATKETGLTPPPSMAVTLTRPSTATRIGRILTGRGGTRQYDKEYSTSAFDLSNREPSCLPPRPGTGKLSRPATGNGTVALTGNQTARVRGKKDYAFLQTAPKIKVSHTEPVVAVVDPTLPGIAPQAKKTRRFSVSGGTIRRSKSVKSSASSSTAAGDPTPPMPSTPGTSAGASRERTPIGSVFNSPGGRDSPGALAEGLMFTVLKRKLDSHQAVYRNGHFPTPPATTGGSRSPVDSIREERLNGAGDSPPRKTDIPNNIPRGQLPYPLAALGDRITGRGVTKDIKRPWAVSEPVVKAEDEKKRADAALRIVWLCICGLYRRCGWISDARGALEEAVTASQGVSGVAGKEGEADVCVEQGLLALETGDKRAAAELFENALGMDVDHPGAIVGLSQILLDIVPSPSSSPSSSSSSPSPLPQKIPSDRPKLPGQLQTKDENEVDYLIRRNRAMGLLMACTSSPRGWDCSEAWYALADALERLGDADGAKISLWKVVGLEDGRGVRELRREAGVRIL